jgi:hypothetical protein
MRNIFDSLALWQIQYSDYSVDMQKSIPEQEMWPSDFFWVTAAACARSDHVFADDCESARPSDDIPPGGRGSVRAGVGPWLALAP